MFFVFVIFAALSVFADTQYRNCPRLENVKPACTADSSGGCPEPGLFTCDNPSEAKEGRITTKKYCPGPPREGGGCSVDEITVTYCSEPPKPCCLNDPIYIPSPNPTQCESPVCPPGKSCTKAPPSKCAALINCDQICEGKPPETCVKCGRYDCAPNN